jgi:transmembrane sensor
LPASQTRFNAQCLDGDVSVTCLEGTVDIRHSGQSAWIGKGQQLSYTRAGIGSSVSIDPAQVTAWQSGVLVFRDRPLVSLVEEVNRYRQGKIVIVNAELKQRAVNGDFESRSSTASSLRLNNCSTPARHHCPAAWSF